MPETSYSSSEEEDFFDANDNSDPTNSPSAARRSVSAFTNTPDLKLCFSVSSVRYLETCNRLSPQKRGGMLGGLHAKATKMLHQNQPIQAYGSLLVDVTPNKHVLLSCDLYM